MPYEYNCQVCGDHQSVPSIDYAYRVGGINGWPVHPVGDGTFRDISGDLCRTCADAYYDSQNRTNCPSCGNDTGVSDIGDIRRDLRPSSRPGVTIGCSGCVCEYTYQCYQCGERHSYENSEFMYLPRCGGRVCMPCYNHYYFQCTSCDQIHRNSQVMVLDEQEYCAECYDVEFNGARIYNYTFRPSPKFFGTDKPDKPNDKTIYYGCELEVFVNGAYGIKNKAKEVKDLLGDRVYLKSDSSIGRGFEIVTHPHTFDAAKGLWGERWKEDIEGVSSHVPGTCGFHVHVSRKPLSPMHIQKIVVFINAPENADLVKTVAQRACHEYGRLKTDKVIGHCRYSEDRYEAINLENKHTIEFRIFRGNMRKDRILKNLEFVKATIDFTRDRSYRSLSATEFMKFVRANRKEFKHLAEYLETRKFHPHPRYMGTRETEK